MILSIAYIIIIGFILKSIFEKFQIPGLPGLLLTGILLGPQLLNLIHPDLLSVSPDLREMALVVILTRVGLSVDLKDLKKAGRPAILLCFLPAVFEIVAIAIFAPILLDIRRLDALVLGTVLAAVSPAVIVPGMLRLLDSGHGKDKCIPQMLLAGASMDDIFAIMLFTAFMGIHKGQSFHPFILARVPISIVSGLLAGISIGLFLVFVFKRFHMRDTVKVLLVLALSFFFIGIEKILPDFVPFSGLIATLSLSAVILKKYEILAMRLKPKLAKIWVPAELVLFVMLGAAVDIRAAQSAGLALLIVIVIGLVFRSIGVIFSTLGASLNAKERIFCIIAYIPKATVQAAIGAIPLAAGLPGGGVILSAAVISIFLTAPLGALGIRHFSKILLECSVPQNDL